MNRLPILKHFDEIRLRFKAAEDRHHRATVLRDKGEIAAAEIERQEAEGDHYAGEMELADLLLMMLRYAIRNRREALRDYLVDAMHDELGPLAEAIARVESRYDVVE